MTKAAKHPAEPKAAPKHEAAVEADLDHPEHASAAYTRVLLRVQSVPEAEIVPLRTDTRVLFRNVTLGLLAIAEKRTELETELPKLDWGAIDGLATLALALHHAAGLVDRSSTGEIRKLVTAAYASRGVLLPLAEALAKKGLLPSKEVADIRRGQGHIDAATDCIDLASLFHARWAKLGAKLPISEADLDEASTTGQKLLVLLRPDAGKKAPARSVTEAIATRDRLFSLLVRDHRELRRAGMWLWADAVDEHVPPLRSFVAERAASAGPAPVPSAPAAPPG